MKNFIPRSPRLRQFGRRILGRAPAPPIVGTLRDWCRDNPACRYETILPEAQFRRPLPRTVDASLPARFTEGVDVTVPEHYFTCIPHARVVDWHGAVILPDGNFLADAQYGEHILVQQRTYPGAREKRAELKRGNYFLLPSPFWKNFGHWTHDCLMRLYQMQARLPTDIKYILPAKARPYQMDMLRYLGILPEQCVRISPEDAWEPEMLYYVPPAQPELSHPEIVAWLRERMRAGMPPAQTQKRRIYISRHKAEWHRVVNEPEVIALLAEYGFAPYVLEDMTWGEQRALFADAEMVVGNQGSGFVNLLFTPPGASALELYQPAFVDICMWNNVVSAGHRYWCLAGESVAAGTHLYDVLVPLPKLRATVEGMLEENNSRGRDA